MSSVFEAQRNVSSNNTPRKYISLYSGHVYSDLSSPKAISYFSVLQVCTFISLCTKCKTWNNYESADSVVDTETSYGLGGSAFEPRWGRDITLPPRPALRPHPATNTTGTGSLPRG